MKCHVGDAVIYRGEVFTVLDPGLPDELDVLLKELHGNWTTTAPADELIIAP